MLRAGGTRLATTESGDEAESKPWTYEEMLTRASGFDAIMDGHCHDD